MRILVFNAGSSSLKCSLFDLGAANTAPGEAAWSGEIEWSGKGGGNLTIDCNGKSIVRGERIDAPHDEAVKAFLARLWHGDGAVVDSPLAVDIVGHRVVHGGQKYTSSVVIDEQVMRGLRGLIELAPSHEPENIGGIEVAARIFPAAKQVAVFDTAFHHNMPESSYRYAVPSDWYHKWGVRRYGFHGISHAYCASRVAELLETKLEELKLVTCHLGSGCSLTAVKDGASIMTTMGYTPLEGVIMRTRSGSIDPGLLLQLVHEGKYSAEEMSTVLNKESGLKGISSLSGDMRELQREAMNGNERAELAIEMFVMSVAAHVGALASYTGGIDSIAFTGGIGENASFVRARICERLEFLGVGLDRTKNEACKSDTLVSPDGCRVAAAVVRCREDIAIARECVSLA